MSRKVDYLDEDTHLPEGQNYVCISFLGDPENKLTLKGIKIRGVFPDYDLACKFAKTTQNKDENFNVYVGEMGKWLPFDPDPNSESSGDAEYANNVLNNIMKKHKDNQSKAKLLHEDRKKFMMNKSLRENLEKMKANLPLLSKAFEEENDEKKKKILQERLDDLNKEIEELEKEKSKIDDFENNLLNDIKEEEEEEEEDNSKNIDI